MQEKLILERMTHLKSIYGLGAKNYMDDPILAREFILECYHLIEENRESMEKHFGTEVVEEIVRYVGKGE